MQRHGMVTDEQVRRLRKLSNTEKNQEIAASKAGMDPTTARRYLVLERLPSELKKERPWRTREDPFGEVWDAVQQQIQESPGLEAKTLFEWLQREYPGRFSDGQIRTLQRRIKLWRVTEGPGQEVYFGQKHTPGRLCASDFTHMTELGITLGGEIRAPGVSLRADVLRTGRRGRSAIRRAWRASAKDGRTRSGSWEQ
jgi:hypothetical protein